jgi:L-iditol 2-dehydrogenase
MKLIKAAVLHGISDIRIKMVEMPKIEKDSDVLIRIRTVGICGSDIHYYKEGKIGSFVVKKPIILGHECAGEIVDVGEAVENVKPGDKVAVEPGVGCGKCKFCREGRYNLCRKVIFMATPPVDGALVEYVVWPNDFVFKLPDDVSFEAGALCEPLSVALQAIKQAGPNPGATIAILGAGPIGLSILQASLSYGASNVYITDLYPLRLKIAEIMGATKVIDASKVDPVEEILDLTDGEGADVVYEATGSPITQKQCFRIVKRGGTIVLVGMTAEEENTVPLLDLVVREYELKGVMRYANVYAQAVGLTVSKRVDLTPMITHYFSLDETKKAFDLVSEKKDEAVKVMVRT